ncbi:MAG: hypothetical protein MI924_22420, partial [Chloroflexales bacterium]|nr:hypothetical protein [Chloroflexales bacterium]
MRRLLGIVLAIAVAAAALPAGMASAQTAYQTSFITSITYQNVGNAPATITFAFYPSSGQPINITRNLPANASDSLYIGAVAEISAGFSGSVVMSSAQPIVATAVQIPMNSPVKVRPLSNGFANGDTRVLVATVLKNTANQNTRFSVQNASNAPINWTVNFIPKGSSTPLHSIPASNIAAGVSVSYDVGNIAQLGAAFDGSATIEASGQVVATALELSVNSTGANSFEGVNAGGATIYMPSALCNFRGQTSFYAITNTSATNSAQVTVTYRNTDGNAAGTQTGTIPAN